MKAYSEMGKDELLALKTDLEKANFKTDNPIEEMAIKQDVIAGNWKIKRSNQILYPSTMGYIKYFLHKTFYFF